MEQIIPHQNWYLHGAWRDTLAKELRVLPSTVATMCIKSALGTAMYFKERRFLGINLHAHGGQWGPLSTYDGYEYCWESVDGRTLNELNIRGSYDEQVLLQILELFERLGNPMKDRWDAVMLFT